jgi:hypothetical protein
MRLDAVTAPPLTGPDLTLPIYLVCRPQWPAVLRATSVRLMDKTGERMADQWVRLGMAIVIIALISIALYQFSGRASAVEPAFHGISYRP